MTVATIKTDRQILEDVLQELTWDSRVDETDVAVGVDGGIVTLSGTMDSLAKRSAAVEAAHRVLGVLDVADEIQIKLPGDRRHTDAEIAHAVRFALEWDAFVPDQRIRSTVSDGCVTLEGEVATLREKEDAAKIVRSLAGVKGLHNFIRVETAKAEPVALRQAIERALARRAEREAERIRVHVENGTVVLEGRVRTWPEKKAVLGAVGHAAGVEEVRDRLSVNPWE
jgi:osmotically-inducible protein OsmY